MNDNYNVAPNNYATNNNQNYNYTNQQTNPANNQGQFNDQQQYQGNINQGYNQVNNANPNPDYNKNQDFAAGGGFDPTSLSRKLTEKTRMGFIRKVYSILMVQLCITAAGVTLSVQWEGFKQFSTENPAFFFIAAGLYIVCVILLGCYKSISQKVPLNYTLLLILTISMTYIV